MLLAAKMLSMSWLVVVELAARVVHRHLVLAQLMVAVAAVVVLAVTVQEH